MVWRFFTCNVKENIWENNVSYHVIRLQRPSYPAFYTKCNFVYSQQHWTGLRGLLEMNVYKMCFVDCHEPKMYWNNISLLSILLIKWKFYLFADPNCKLDRSHECVRKHLLRASLKINWSLIVEKLIFLWILSYFGQLQILKLVRIFVLKALI